MTVVKIKTAEEKLVAALEEIAETSRESHLCDDEWFESCDLDDMRRNANHNIYDMTKIAILSRDAVDGYYLRKKLDAWRQQTDEEKKCSDQFLKEQYENI